MIGNTGIYIALLKKNSSSKKKNEAYTKIQIENKTVIETCVLYCVLNSWNIGVSYWERNHFNLHIYVCENIQM